MTQLEKIRSESITFKDLLQFELYKVYLIRGNRIRFFLGIALPLLFMGFFWLGLHGKNPGTFDATGVRDGVFNLGGASLLVATVSAVYFATSELRNGSAIYAIVSTRSRFTWIQAKLVTAILFGCAITILSELEVVLFGKILFHSLNIDYNFFTARALEREFGFCISGLFGSLIGVGVGLLLRSQMLAVITVIVYTMGIETWLLVILPNVAKYLIGGGYESITGDSTQTHNLGVLYGYLLLTAWSCLFIGLGTWTTLRSDIQWKEN